MATQSNHQDKEWGVLAEFDNVDQLQDAVCAVRDAGFSRWDVHTPFPVHRIDRFMGLKATPLPWLVLAAGITGLGAGLFLCWWTNATLVEGVPVTLQGYPWIISGKPFFSLPANIPVIFELTVLFSAFAAVLGMAALNRLPQLSHPLFTKVRFRRATQDRFFIAIERSDPQYSRYRLDDLLKDKGAVSIEKVEDA